jgi:cytochrome c oxidase subunit 2
LIRTFLSEKEGQLKMARNLIILVLTVSATAAGAWARQAKDDVDQVKTIDVIASQFKFEPATISVVKGDRVRLRLQSADRTHGIGIEAFRVKSLIPKVREAVTVEFVADRAGTFDITCSEYCGTGHRAMKGKLIVLAGAE